jgi:two-component system cell cycle sensor histidine kinase/response regulator CckA
MPLPLPKTVLVVDDEELIRALTARTLQEAGYRVLTASNGYEALKLLTQLVGSVDLLVIDLRMPGMSGEQLADRVRQCVPAALLLFMSGYSSPEETGSLPGPFLAKPFSHADLLNNVHQLLQRKIGG